jgi:hypothetical protein
MNGRKLIWIAPLLALACGCIGANDPLVRVTLDQMVAENAALEDRYYDLEAKYLRAKDELARCNVPSVGSTANRIKPTGSSPTPAEIPIEFGEEFDPEMFDQMSAEVSTKQTVSGDAEFIEVGVEDQNHLQIQLQTGELEIGPINHIAFEPSTTGGFDQDGDAVDDGFMVSLLPKDTNGNSILQPADVLVSLIDPAENGEAQRIGFWEISADEIAQLISESESPQSIQFVLPWQSVRPQHTRLMLFVRYLKPNAQFLETSINIAVNIPGQLGRRPRGEEVHGPRQMANGSTPRLAEVPREVSLEVPSKTSRAELRMQQQQPQKPLSESVAAQVPPGKQAPPVKDVQKELQIAPASTYVPLEANAKAPAADWKPRR